MVYMLFDNPADKKKMEFLKNYDIASFKLIFPEEQCKSVKSMVKVCRDCIKSTSKSDVIVCWYDFMGVLCWWLCKILHMKRRIIALNILLKNKKSTKNLVAKMLYRPALKSRNTIATVTSKEYGEAANKMLGINKKYVLLHDIYHGGYEVDFSGNMHNDSVFCGGRNGRDWIMLLKLTKEMPEIQFNIVAPKDIYEEYKGSFGRNVNIRTEIPESEFLQLMCQSSLVLMPLDTEAPAGLIAMFQAAANGKMVITSDTVTTREYFENQRGVLCKKNINEWKEQIRYWLNHLDEAGGRAKRLRLYLEKECSEKKYVEILEKIVAR